jgi:hypothetical protein
MAENYIPDPRVVEYIEKSIRESETPDKPVLAAGINSYSKRQLLEEVRAGTAFGRELEKGLVECLEEDMRLGEQNG